MTNILYKEESYQILGALFEVHNNLGGGFLESVYSEAIQYEFRDRGIPFEKEKKYRVKYKENFLSQFYFADFIVFDKIILEIKSVAALNDTHIAQCINYLKISKNKLAILVNFEADRLMHQRIIL
ncbi:MAG: GxxExxY protein [Gillisia sp.]